MFATAAVALFLGRCFIAKKSFQHPDNCFSFLLYLTMLTPLLVLENKKQRSNESKQRTAKSINQGNAPRRYAYL